MKSRCIILLVVDPGGGAGAYPLQVQILSFWHTNFLKSSHLGSWFPPWGQHPPTGNPGSATAYNGFVSCVCPRAPKIILQKFCMSRFYVGLSHYLPWSSIYHPPEHLSKVLELLLGSFVSSFCAVQQSKMDFFCKIYPNSWRAMVSQVLWTLLMYPSMLCRHWSSIAQRCAEIDI